MVLRLGPFELERPVARGGTAEVWRARHGRRGVPAAVKVLRPPPGLAAVYGARLLAEAQAMARLHHPGVIRLYDQDAVPPAVAAASEGALPAGAPYLVMEWVEGGTLRAGRCDDWPTLVGVLRALLDALAHAHAHGVIHRDLKPDNVLLAARGPVLSDFGLALAPVEAVEAREVVGTPAYMAPEQVRGDAWAAGPWTDLYALGCLGWELAAGRPPFWGIADDMPSLLRAHLVAPPPPLRARFAVPAGFAGWLARLLAKAPLARYRFAAEAAAALAALGEPATVAAAARDGIGEGIGDGTRGETATLDALRDTLPAGVHDTAATADLPPLAPSTPPPVVPLDGDGVPEFAPLPLPDVGRSVGRLRVPPPIGRRGERAALWSALRAATLDGVQVVLVEGPAGLGKRHLARWVARRAHALGVAGTLRIEHDALGGPSAGLGAAFAAALRCAGLDEAGRRAQLGALLADVLDGPQIAALAAAIGEAEPGDEALGVYARVIAAMASRRPLVVLIGDAQWGEASLRLVDRLLAGVAALPVLVVATVRDDAVRRPAALAALARHPRVRSLAPGPMPAAELAQIAQSLLPLERPLCDALVERAAGSPLFVVELVRDWMAREALEAGPAGFRLRGGAAAEIPAEMGALWLARLADAPVDAAGRDALAIAAVLGVRVDRGEWAAACAEAGVAPPAAAVEWLVAERLARPLDDGWSFAHPMLREALVEAARRDRRLARWHGCCAAALRARGEGPLRIAEHLLGAGRPAAAWPWLRAAARRALVRVDLPALRRIARRCLTVLRGRRTRRRQRPWVEARVWWAAVRLLEGRYAAARRGSRVALEGARRVGPGWLRVEALMQLGSAAAATGEAAASVAAFEEAARRAERLGDRVLRARVWGRLGWALAESGRPVEAEALLHRALAALDGVTGPEVPVVRANALRNLADLGRRQGSPAAEHHAREALAAMLHAGMMRRAAEVECILGDLHRYRGEPGPAAALYRQAAERLRAIDAPEAPFAEANEALALVEQAQFGEARAILTRLVEADPGEGPAHLLASIARACLLPCDAHFGAWHDWDARFAGLGPLIDGRVKDPDIARQAARAAAIAAAAGEGSRAAQAEALAAAQRAAMDQRR
ncbi:MAG: serine/threonine-protein kinase [bacterium]